MTLRRRSYNFNNDTKSLSIGGQLVASTANITANSVQSSGTINSTGIVFANANIASTSTTTGALVVLGGVGLSGNLTATNLTGTLLTASQTNLTTVGNLTAITVGGSTSLIGVVYANASTPSTSTTSGALRVTGGIGVTGNISAGGQITIAGAVAATQADATALAIALG